MANADKLWEVLNKLWPSNKEWLTLEEIYQLIPIGTEDIDNLSSYDFAMLTLLSTSRRKFLEHKDELVEAVISDEVVKVNRNNGIWRKHLQAKVKKAMS
jgi:hypothetical protein